VSILIKANPATPHQPVFKAIFATLLKFQAVWRQRKQLSEMDAHIRTDLGLSDAAIESEIRRPIWDAPRNWKA